MRDLRRLLIGLASAAIWPLYLVLVAFAAKVAPGPATWPGRRACSCSGWPAALFVANAGRMAFRKRGWAEEVLLAPREVTCQLRRVVLTWRSPGSCC